MSHSSPRSDEKPNHDQAGRVFEDARRNLAPDSSTEEASLREQMARLAAGFANFRKRAKRDAQAERDRLAGGLALAFLPVADTVDLALRHAPDEAAHEAARGMVAQTLLALGSLGGEHMSPQGEAFNPMEHRGMAMAPSEGVPEGSVLAVERAGYRTGGMSSARRRS